MTCLQNDAKIRRECFQRGRKVINYESDKSRLALQLKRELNKRGSGEDMKSEMNNLIKALTFSFPQHYLEPTVRRPVVLLLAARFHSSCVAA